MKYIFIAIMLIGCSKETLNRKVTITYICESGCIGSGDISGEPLVVSMPYGLEENFEVIGYHKFEKNIEVGKTVILRAVGGKVRLIYNGVEIEAEYIHERIR
jgi:hypothetical protein